jgi:hypothetical protein
MIKKYIKSFIVATIFIFSTAFISPGASVSAQNATYSCGAYGASTYSQNNCGGSIKPPNTGFAKLLEPDVLIPTSGSLVALLLGIGIIVFKLRKHKAAAASDSR